MILVCGEALIDLFVGPAAGAEMPARHDADLPTVADVEASLSAADLATEISEIDLRKGFA